MKTIHLPHASPFGRSDKAESLRLRIDFDHEVPRSATLEIQTTVHRHGAEQLNDALLSTLPGGMYDQLFAVMAEHKASTLLVRHERPRKKPRRRARSRRRLKR